MNQWTDQNQSMYFGINSKVIKGDLMEVYLRYDKDFNLIIDRTSDSLKERNFGEVIQLLINDEEIETQWLPAKKINGDIGLASMINVEHLKEGRHNLTIATKSKYQEIHKKYLNRPFEINIPFWIDKSRLFKVQTKHDSLN